MENAGSEMALPFSSAHFKSYLSGPEMISPALFVGEMVNRSQPETESVA